MLARVFPLILSGCALSFPLRAVAQSPVSVPRDIILLIGQSNMAGRGVVVEQDLVVHPRIFKLTEAKTWAPAIDPLHFDKPAIAGVGLGSSFARVLAETEPDAVIGLIPAAFGGSALDEWAPGAPHYVNAVERARLALGQGGRLRAILWHQGEADRAPEKMATYPQRFSRLIAQLRTDLNAPGVPVIVGELYSGRAANGPMNAVLNALPATVAHCASVSAEGLVDNGDQTHFTSPSLREFGRRYAAAFLKLERMKQEATKP